MPSYSGSARFALRLIEAMTEAGKPPKQRGVPAELRRRHGVKSSTVAGWLQGEYMPEPDKVRVMASDYKVNYEWLYFGTEPKRGSSREGGPAEQAPQPPPLRLPLFTIRGVDGTDGLNPATDVMLNVVDVEVSAGNPAEGPPHFDYLPTRYQLPYQLSWLHQFGATPDDILVMPVRGNSMRGVVWDGDLAVIHRRRNRIINGYVYAFVDPTGLRMKRLALLDDGRLRVRSSNRDKKRYPDEFLAGDERNRLLILGTVIDRSGRGGLSPNDDDDDDEANQ